MFRECFMNSVGLRSYGNDNHGAASHHSPPGAASVTGPE